MADIDGIPLYFNGRFLGQSITGVQRFATEISAAFRQLYPGKATFLTPRGTPSNGWETRPVGRLKGHAWEQMELARHAKDGMLVNLGNTAPIFARNQVVVLHDAGVYTTPDAYSWQFRSWYSFMQQRLVRPGVRIATVSDFSRAEIARCLGVPAAAVAVIGEGADHMSKIVADPRILATAGLVPGQFVLTVGSLSAHKNLAALDQLAKSLAQRGMTLVVAGGLAGRVFHETGRTRLPQPARYIGRVNDGELKCLYQSAACYVFPSRYEGFGLPAVEAMASGAVVVAANIPALREVCGDAAIYCNPDQPADFAARVCSLLDDAPLADRLRRAGREQAAHHTWARAARMLAQVIGA